MWYLIELKTNKRFYLLLNKPMYTVSRTADLGDLVLTGDASISRSHATLHPDRDHVKLVDTGSKYGTFVNGNLDTNVQMERNVPAELHEHDKIRFGRLEGVWRLERIVINALSTTLSVAQKIALKQDLVTINGTLLTDWNNQCTHLTVAEVTITMKVLHALAGTVPIVTPAYWTACIEAAAVGAVDLPDVNAYRPAIVENYIPAGISIAPNAERRRLFVHKEFVFMMPRHQERYELCIRLAGGRCSSLDRKRVGRRTLLKPHMCVVQYNPSTQSQSTDDMGQVSRFLHEHQLRSIPESEIGMALLHCSTRKYCNPAFRVDAEFAELQGLVVRTPSAVLAAASEATREGTMNSHEHIEVAETKPPETDDGLGVANVLTVEATPVSDAMFGERRSLNSDDAVVSNIYDSMGGSLKRSASPEPEVAIAVEPRAKRKRPSAASDEKYDESPKTFDSDSLLMPMADHIDIKTQPTHSELQKSMTQSTSSQNTLNSSGFLPRIRQPTNLPSQTGAAIKPVHAAAIPAATSASRKRAHQRLLANDDSDGNDDDADDQNGPNLFQFNAGPALPKRSRRSDNDTQSLADSQPTASSCSTKLQPKRPQQQQQNVSRNISVSSAAMWHDSGAELYPNRRCASRLNISVPCLQISLLTGWLSKSSIKCEPKDEVDGDGSVVERKPSLTAEGRIADDVSADGVLLVSSRLRIASRTNGSVPEHGERKNFKAFTKKNNYRVQTRILKTIPAIPSTANMLDF